MLLPFGFYLLKLFGEISHNNNLKSVFFVAFLVQAWLAAACWLWQTAQADAFASFGLERFNYPEFLTL
jgi:hypothetical protein